MDSTGGLVVSALGDAGAPVLAPSVAVGTALPDGAGVAAEVDDGATLVDVLVVVPEPSLPPHAATMGPKVKTSAAAAIVERRA
jgi:hypothetical protein